MSLMDKLHLLLDPMFIVHRNGEEKKTCVGYLMKTTGGIVKKDGHSLFYILLLFVLFLSLEGYIFDKIQKLFGI